MVRQSVHRNREHGMGKSLDNVAALEIVLTVPIGSQPPRCNIVHAVAGNERIVVGLRNLVAQRGDILKSATEQPGSDPARVVYDISFFHVAVRGSARLEVIAMKSENAALGGITVEIEIGVGEKDCGNVLGRDLAGVLG